MGTVGGRDGYAFGISESLAVVGRSHNLGGTERATLWLNGSPVDLGGIGGNLAVAYAINDSNQIVGTSQSEHIDSYATLWTEGRAFDLNLLVDQAASTAGWSLRDARAINNNGQIAGFAYN